MTNEYNPDGKEIRFIDSHYKDLFHIPDGSCVQIHYPDETVVKPCTFIDEYHTQIGYNVFRHCSSTSKIIATQGKSISSTASLDIAKNSLKNTVRKSQFIKRRNKPLMNCRLQSSRPCNRCMRNFISWQSRKSKTTLSTVKSEKRRKNC